MNGKFWTRHARLGWLFVSIVYNGTFSMTDGRIHGYHSRDADIPISTFSLRIGHLWLNLDILL